LASSGSPIRFPSTAIPTARRPIPPIGTRLRRRPHPKKQFELQYKGAEEVDWQADGTIGLNAPWFENEEVMVAEWWRREKVRRTILLLSDQTVMEAETYLANKGLLDAMGRERAGRARDREPQGDAAAHDRRRSAREQ